MMKSLFVIIMICLCPITINAQKYMVVRVAGSVFKVTGDSKQPIQTHQQLQASDVVNIGTYSMLELLDEKGKRTIRIKSPGQNNLKNMISTKSNSIVEISKQYIDYIKSKASNQRQIAMSDPATITMQGINGDSLYMDMFDVMNGQLEDEPMGFRQMVMHEYADFRKQCIEQYIQFVRESWQEYHGHPAEALPQIKEVEPIEYDSQGNSLEEHAAISLPFDKVIKVEEDGEQPKPMTRIPEVSSLSMSYNSFSFYGTSVRVRVNKSLNFRVMGVDEGKVADALVILGKEDFDNTIRDCLEIRYELQLSDWAYLLMLRQMAEQIYGEETNEATLLTAYVFMQSGYKVRLASDKYRLYMLWASKHHIYGKNYYELNGDRYYSLEKLPMTMHICNVSFPKEKSLSLLIPSEQLFNENYTETRTVHASKYPDVSISFQSNKNLMDFYNSYPSSKLGDDVMSRWAMYANTPLQSKMKEQIYPALQQAIQDCSEEEAVEKLLNLVQTGFVYEYDDRVWGEDRVFFAEESLFYPFCDCEDRSILFTRLVRDLCGLKCVLVYYPGHLAAGVSFSNHVQGDYINLDGKYYTIADPTFIGAPVGRTMTGMDNTSAIVILLD